MKKLFLIVCAFSMLAACAAPTPGINVVPAKLTKAIEKAGKSCATSADCAAVQKGCCLCAGYEAVNQESVAKVQAVFESSCAQAACTREMCYVEIEPVCEQNVCVGKPILPKGQR